MNKRGFNRRKKSTEPLRYGDKVDENGNASGADGADSALLEDDDSCYENEDYGAGGDRPPIIVVSRDKRIA
jgi:hypothetical protein